MKILFFESLQLLVISLHKIEYVHWRKYYTNNVQLFWNYNVNTVSSVKILWVKNNFLLRFSARYFIFGLLEQIIQKLFFHCFIFLIRNNVHDNILNKILHTKSEIIVNIIIYLKIISYQLNLAYSKQRRCNGCIKSVTPLKNKNN